MSEGVKDTKGNAFSINNVNDKETKNEVRLGTNSNKEDLVGTIGKKTGTGKHAQDSFVWITITWSFYIGIGLSILFYIRSFFDVGRNESILNSIIEIWKIFLPIITLALGYAFGKGK